MRGILAGTVLAATITAADANQLDSAKACSAIADSLQRLTCFDRVFPASEVDAATADEAPAEPEVTSTAKWEVKESKSAIDDSPTVQAYLLPTEVRGTGIGQSEMILLLRCQENTTGAVFSTDLFMTSDQAKVTLRFGDAPAETERWSVASNYKAVGRWSGAQAIPFIKRLTENEKLVVRIEDRNRTDAQFDLGNVREVAEKIATACNWKLD